MKLDRKTTLMVVLAVTALVFTYAMAVYVVPRALVTMTKAAPASVVSLTNSKLIGQKILAKADGKETCLVNVFVLDSSGKGVANKPVSLEGLASIEPAEVQSDSEGRATFRMTSATQGTFKLTATVSGASLPGELKVTFR